MTDQTCPYCGDKWAYRDPTQHYSTRYMCGALVRRDGTTRRGEVCYITELEKKDAEIERLRQALEDYGDHSEKCKRKGADCFCGFDTARGEVK